MKLWFEINIVSVARMGAALAGMTMSLSPEIFPAALDADRDAKLIESLEGLRAADIRLATIHYRLARANLALCDRRTRLSGLVLHQLSSYDTTLRPLARSYFEFSTPIAVAGVIGNTPAARAGFKAGDSIAAIDEDSVDNGTLSGADVTTIEDRIAGVSANKQISLAIIRSGIGSTILTDTEDACAGHAEVGVSRSFNAATDGTTIQINSALMNLLPADDELAPIVAHEMAHIILRHQERLTAARVDRGLFRDFGRNARLIRQTEIEADRLSVYLLANAGYDATQASHYLQAHAGPHHVNSILAGKTHLRVKVRIALLDSEAATAMQAAERPIVPQWISARDQPLR